MAIINTTSTIDSSMFLKTKLPKNLVGENFYIDNLQEKRNYDWQFRYNLVDIEEELDKQCEYTKDAPLYTPIDVVIRRVKSEKGQDLGTDWAEISFREFKHPNDLGRRYRFHKDFADMTQMTAEEKHYNTSIWININKSPFDAGNSCVIRRCNANFAMVGSPTKEFNRAKEIHYEPVVLDNELKYINTYYNMAVPVPQAEWYATMQMNYFTNCIEINNRFVVGGTDTESRTNNTTFKVKAIVKTNSEVTFAKQGSSEINNIPLIILGLDKDMVQEADNMYTRVANAAPVYKIIANSGEGNEPNNSIVVPTLPTIGLEIDKNDTSIGNGVVVNDNSVYTIQLNDENNNKILLGETIEEIASVYKDGEKVDSALITFDYKLDKIIPSYWNKYFDFNIDGSDNNKFYIKNKKTYLSGKLYIDATYDYVNSSGNPDKITQTFEFELASFY